MPFGTVTVNGQDGRDVYAGGEYGTPVGTAPGPFVVPYGKHTFETLTPARCIDFRQDGRVNKSHKNIVIVLAPVDPPECI